MFTELVKRNENRSEDFDTYWDGFNHKRILIQAEKTLQECDIEDPNDFEIEAHKQNEKEKARENISENIEKLL